MYFRKSILIYKIYLVFNDVQGMVLFSAQHLYKLICDLGLQTINGSLEHNGKLRIIQLCYSYMRFPLSPLTVVYFTRNDSTGPEEALLDVWARLCRLPFAVLPSSEL